MKSLLALFLLAGCAQFGPTAEQAKAMEGTSASNCIQSLVYGTAHFATFGGKSTGTGGGGGKATCGASVVEFNNVGKADSKAAP
jgi:hypothetical protein